MDEQKQKNAVVLVLLGPTASGKTKALSELDGKCYEIVSCDSRQIYKGLETITAAPSMELQKQLRHHLVSCLEPKESITAGCFARLAKQAFRDIISRKKTPILVGGSGFYYRALSTKMFPVETPMSVHKQIESMSKAERLRLLKKLDPQALISIPGEIARNGRIHPNDTYRVFRALEITLASGKKWSSFWQNASSIEDTSAKNEFSFHGVWFDPEDTDYAKALSQRTQEMVKADIVTEVGQVYEKYGLCPGLVSLGCRAALEVYKGEAFEKDLAERLFQLHRQYAKKQQKWLRKEKQIKAIVPQDFTENWSLLEAKANYNVVGPNTVL